MPRFGSDFGVGILATLALVWLSCHALGAHESNNSNPQAKIDFVRQIQPILQKHCYQCHGRDVQEVGLRLDVKRHALAGGENGRMIIPGEGKKSRLVTLISGEDDDGRRMPPKDEAPPLSRNQVALIRAWIDAGAAWPDGVDPVAKQPTDLWSFVPVRRPPIPSAARADWVRNPIDAFILAKLEAAGMKPIAPAEPLALIRRAYFDLLGLPPTPAEVQAFEEEAIRIPHSAIKLIGY